MHAILTAVWILSLIVAAILLLFTKTSNDAVGAIAVSEQAKDKLLKKSSTFRVAGVVMLVIAAAALIANICLLLLHQH